MTMRGAPVFLMLLTLLGAPPCPAAERLLDGTMQHIRLGDQREWSDFPAEAEGDRFHLQFDARANAAEQSLQLRHADLKQTWTLLVNGQAIGKLPRDENRMVTWWALPPGTLVDGRNTLEVVGSGRGSDDVWIGDVRLDERPRDEVLSAAEVALTVVDADTNQPLPCRVTIVDRQQALVTSGAVNPDEPAERVAVRPGVIYTATGRAHFTLPPGDYTLYAGRGFEYGVDSVAVSLAEGDSVAHRLAIRREVDTGGWIACDTHCHTLTYSGHGDSTIAERMVTLAGEAIELPIASDHNVQIDYAAMARQVGVDRYFTPVVGNEVTTRIGHFNVFPLEAGGSIDHTAGDWPTIFANIFAAPRASVVVLNHARDLHSGFRPFGPERHLAVAGENSDGWQLRANAMEVVNSGALQTDPLRLPLDWMAMLNRGNRLTPIGASDSHDVARHFVGQGRTYLRGNDTDPGHLDVDAAVQSLLDGHVNVSLGLLCELVVNQQAGPGDLAATTDDTLTVDLRVLGPTWTRATHVALYANGLVVAEQAIGEAPSDSPPGVKWQATWQLPRPAHDVHLVAIARGPGIEQLSWPIAKAYQPTSPDWQSYVLGISGPVLVDADGDGRFQCAHDYAEQLVTKAAGDLPRLIDQLASYDQAVAVQVASLLRAGGLSPLDDRLGQTLAGAAPQVRAGFADYRTAWRESVAARAQQ